MSLTAVPTLVVASCLVSRCAVCSAPLGTDGKARRRATADQYPCSVCGAELATVYPAPVLPPVSLPPTSKPVPPVPVYAPVPVVAAPKLPPVDRAMPAPRAIVFKRMAPCECYSCKGQIASGADCTMDAKGRMVHPACLVRPEGSRKAPEPKPAPECPHCDVSESGEHARQCPVNPAAPKVEPPAVTYYVPNVQHDSHVNDWLRDAPRTAPEYVPPVAAKPAPVAPLAKPAPVIAPSLPAPTCAGPAGSFTAHLDGAEFKLALAQCAALAPRKATVTYCECINVRHVNGRTVLQATDLDTWLAVEVNSKGSGDGACAINAATLKGTLGKGKPPTVKLEYHAEGTLTMAGANLRTLPGAEYPKAPQLAGANLEAADAIGEMLRKVRDAVATDESRPHLAGVMLGNRDGHAVAVATDGHRLHLVERSGMQWPWSQDVIVNRTGVDAIIRACTAVTGTPRVGLDAERNWLHVRLPGYAVACKLVNTTFPPFEMVVPKDHDGRCTVIRSDLEAALQDCATIRKGDVPFTKWAVTVDGTLTLTAEHADRGSIKRDVLCEANKPLTIGLNAAYVMDALAACDSETVTLEYQGELDPVVIRPERTRATLAVIMPTRI